MTNDPDPKRHVSAGERYALERAKRRLREKTISPSGEIIDRNTYWPKRTPNARTDDEVRR